MNEKTLPIVASYFPEHHKIELTQALVALRASGDPYPPRQDVDDSPAALFGWLMNETATHRSVALLGGKVAGHISLVNPHPYLTSHLEEFHADAQTTSGFLEISKFFVNPNHQRKGVGGALFAKAVEDARIDGYSPALAVISTSTDAISFYKYHGLMELGSFDGVHGKNFVFA